jgi:hypothetical protein
MKKSQRMRVTFTGMLKNELGCWQQAASFKPAPARPLPVCRLGSEKTIQEIHGIPAR